MVVHTKSILFLKSLSERVGFDIKRLENCISISGKGNLVISNGYISLGDIVFLDGDLN